MAHSQRRRTGRHEDTGGTSVGQELAHARARFAIDPGTPASLDDAWTAPTGVTEEDESGFVDFVADFLSVGLPIDAAAVSWRSSALAVTAEGDNDDDDTSIFDEEITSVYPRRLARH
jgi:hypothetical protein